MCDMEVFDNKYDNHIELHKKMERFGQGLEKGKIVKKKVNKGRAGKVTNWNVSRTPYISAQTHSTD